MAPQQPADLSALCRYKVGPLAELLCLTGHAPLATQELPSIFGNLHLLHKSILGFSYGALSKDECRSHYLSESVISSVLYHSGDSRPTSSAGPWSYHACLAFLTC